ncbi:MAG: oxidoreductase, partial [Betaproteobacteria bacterium]|nr:oxidoreductase [Betaproteobacteria bacterium]
MAKLIRNRRAAADSWQLLELGAAPKGAAGALPPVLDDGDVIVPLALWQARRGALAVRGGRTGVWLDSHEAPD